MTKEKISFEKEKEILINLRALLKNEVFLTPGITINSLAEMLNTNRQYLSVVINKYYRNNFNKLINEYRIGAAINLFELDRDFKFTIEYVATETGFKNRTSFIQAFKDHTGLTPSAFREKYRNC